MFLLTASLILETNFKAVRECLSLLEDDETVQQRITVDLLFKDDDNASVKRDWLDDFYE